MATFNFIRPNLSKENAEVQEYLLRLLNELDHIVFEDKASVNNYTEVYQDSSIEEEASFTGGTYRKWKSGLAELWGTASVTIGTVGRYDGSTGAIGVSDDNYGISYPALFTEAPNVQATIEKNNASGWLVTVSKGSKDASPRYKVLGLYSYMANQSATIHFYCVGRWK
jgi:hypothetical protein